MSKATTAERALNRKGGTMSRLIKTLFGFYPVLLPLVVAGVVLCAIINSIGATFLQSALQIISESWQSGDWGAAQPKIAQLVTTLACIYGIGILSSLFWNRAMAIVTQGSLEKLREKMFNRMQDLPIKYFDTHSHGDIMSIYTNDIDTLRQMISQSIPQVFSSFITVVGTLGSMLVLSVPLTAVSLIMVALMMFVTGKVAGLSGKYFVKQQKNIGKVNGYIEEMVEGQKVVKVFCHEDKSLEEFKALNDELCDSAYNANKFANLMGPINAQLGNLSYVVCAIVGGAMALGGFAGLTLGKLASFLTFNKSFNMPISQVSQQLNSIVMAQAGAKRVFDLLDEPVETDEGYVTIVRAKKVNGKIVECTERTGMWAWKHVHQADGSVDYIELQGEVVFDDVDFGYNDDKIVLHNIEMYAKPGQKIAFVGSTGAGKTTITNLINRFYDIQDGKIRFDGINVNKIKKETSDETSEEL